MTILSEATSQMLLVVFMSVGPAVPLESELGASNLLAPIRFPSDKCENAP